MYAVVVQLQSMNKKQGACVICNIWQVHFEGGIRRVHQVEYVCEVHGG
jgi:hypothetical protein